MSIKFEELAIGVDWKAEAGWVSVSLDDSIAYALSGMNVSCTCVSSPCRKKG